MDIHQKLLEAFGPEPGAAVPATQAEPEAAHVPPTDVAAPLIHNDDWAALAAAVGPPPTPYADATNAALSAFLIDGARVRIASVDATFFVVVVTTKPLLGTDVPIINAGVEPHSIIQKAEEIASIESGTRVRVERMVGPAAHTAWALTLGNGRLIRTWRRGPRNEDERYYVAKRAGVVKQVPALDYAKLRGKMG